MTTKPTQPLAPLSGPHWSLDQALVHTQAAALGWTVDWEPAGPPRSAAGRFRMVRGDWELTAVFSHDGSLAYGRSRAADRSEAEFGLIGVLDALEQHTPSTVHRAPPTRAAPAPVRRGPPAGETPEGEGSTTAGISVPEPPELRTAWGAWPMLLIALLVLSVLVFMVARIFSW
ncbi:DUF6480 family protein [Kitasatospora sp. NPDC006697]|uniref:DUF6480 family protein n=1 Tax=Kitasatospora sp. NPDC006697 TaxID=3364020 RepID=UPI003680BD1A